jgi:hypothetical protein
MESISPLDSDHIGRESFTGVVMAVELSRFGLIKTLCEREQRNHAESAV